MIPATIDNPNEVTPRAIRHMAQAVKRDLPWFSSGPAHMGELVIVGGGPSMQNRAEVVGLRRKNGGTILALNGASRFLRDNDVTVDIVLLVDPGPTVAGFIDDDVGDDSLYIIASICAPAVFDKLEGREVFVWHPELPGQIEQQKAILELYPEKPVALIGGGNTCALRSLNIGYLMGYRTFHLYGVDSSYERGGADHAYVKHEGTEPEPVTLMFNEKAYCCSPWMVRQADEFRFYYQQFSDLGCNIVVHGEGLIPDIWRVLRASRRKAA